VFASGNISCPNTGYTAKRSYYDSQDVKDTRACSASCGCGSPSGVSCAAKFAFWARSIIGNPACSDKAIATYTVPTACDKAPPNVGAMEFTLGGFSGGTCSVGGTVTPTGGCYPMGSPVTTCCVP
jgi:hypothetical protein